MNKISTKEMATTALLIAIGILIPLVFTTIPFRWTVGPYTATLMAHVPVIIAMFISPMTALMTAVGTTIGFFITADTVVAVRAASHILFAFVGSYMIVKMKANLIVTCLVTGMIHAIFEALVVLVFFKFGWSSPKEGYSVAVQTWITFGGTFAHHIVDYIIACAVYKGLIRAKAVPSLPQFGKK